MKPHVVHAAVSPLALGWPWAKLRKSASNSSALSVGYEGEIEADGFDSRPLPPTPKIDRREIGYLAPDFSGRLRRILGPGLALGGPPRSAFYLLGAA